MAIYTKGYARVCMPKLRLCLLWRRSVVEKQRCMRMPEGMEPTARKTKRIEDRRQFLFRNIFRS